ncbi:glycoside hydrolase family 113 [Paenibacillus humicus]|uniref:glycoside hydrolase family 113 n=1 Tax=Paenibacillus humicus TaxID=412861 RepID=UPI000FD84DCC|nr:hypothetical protein [Paenibacillus humicus]
MPFTPNIGLKKWDSDTEGLNRMQFTKNFEVIDEKVGGLYGATNLKVRSASVSITAATTHSEYYENLPHLNKVFARVAAQGIGVTLCPYANMTTGPTSNTFDRIPEAKLQAVIDAAKSKGARIDMLKPHIVTNWSDGFARRLIAPTDIDAHFANWTAELLHFAKLADRNGIPWLCISCEQQAQTTDSFYFAKWQSLVSTIRYAYPNLKLTVAYMLAELLPTISKVRANPDDKCLLHLVDAIGHNVYLGAYWDYYYIRPDGKPSITVQDVERSLYRDNGDNRWMARFQEIRTLFNDKPQMITEFGCFPLTGGLIKPIATGLGTTDYNAQALLFQAFFDTLMPLPYMIGFAIWHTNAPFNYFDVNDPALTSAEKLILDYTTRGVI